MYWNDWAEGDDSAAAAPAALLRLLTEVEERNVNRAVRWSSDNSACVRITQKELSLSCGDRIVTHVEALYRDPQNLAGSDEPSGATVVFSIRHMHSLSWARELSVHRSILTACYLADVEPLVELPESSISLCETAESSSQLLRTHIFIEKMISHLRFNALGNEVSVFWWRAVKFGCLALQNWQSGRLMLLESKGKSIKDGVIAIRQFYQLAFAEAGGGMPEDFWFVEPEYDAATTAAQEEAKIASQTTYTSSSQIAQTLESWTLEDGVSPWLTKLVVKKHTRGKVQSHFRYSLGVEIQQTIAEEIGQNQNSENSRHLPTDSSSLESQDETPEKETVDPSLMSSPPDHPQSRISNRGEEIVTDSPQVLGSKPSVYLLIQVHFNEPLSRELRAYPVCMIPVYIHSASHGDLTLIYLRCLWFLRKLYQYHSDCQESLDIASRAKLKNSNLGGFRRIQRIDQNDLSQKNKLIGGAKLINRKRLIA